MRESRSAPHHSPRSPSPIRDQMYREWCRHSDRLALARPQGWGGGALAMRTYGHLRDEHSQAMAAKVRCQRADNPGFRNLPLRLAANSRTTFGACFIALDKGGRVIAWSRAIPG